MQHDPNWSPFQKAAVAELLAARSHYRVWQHLIPPSAVATRDVPGGDVEYLHPTKGWRRVSRRRFALYS